MNKYIDNLTWDSKYFGINVGKTNIQSGINLCIEKIMESVKSEKINLLYHYQNPSEIEDINALEANSFNLVDQRVNLSMKLKKKSNSLFDFTNVYEFNSNDKETDISNLYNISYEISKLSRYAYDRNISEEKCRELYKLWIYNSIYNNFCDKTFVYKVDNIVYGFIMLKIDYKLKTSNISLIGVGGEYRNKGIGTILIQKSIDYLVSNAIEILNVDTQMRNIGALNLYINNQFKISETTLIYHLWNNVK